VIDFFKSNFITLFLAFSDNPTSSTELCSLYCKIQLYLGSECVPLITTETTASTETTTTTTTTTASSTLTTIIAEAITLPSTTLISTTSSTDSTLTTIALASCPSQYEGDPEMELLCQLWIQLQALKQQFNSNPILTTALASTSCLYRQVLCIYVFHTLNT
jgi:hypothetical protein